MTYLYIVDHYIPFPASEYGGVWNVIAKSDDECFDLITAKDDGFYAEYYSDLKDKIIKAQRFALANDQTSRVVDSFTT